MKYINFEFSEIDIINILNALSYFRNDLLWHDNSIAKRERIAMYIKFDDDFYNKYDIIDNLHKRISLQANREMYNIINNYYFKGQQEYLIHKNFDFLELKRYKSYLFGYKNKKINKKIQKSIDKILVV